MSKAKIPAAAQRPTLRDMYAMAALQGLLGGEWLGTPDEGAKQSYKLADAMLKARRA